MKTRAQTFLRFAALPLLLLGTLAVVVAAAQMTVARQPNGEMALTLPAPNGEYHRFETSSDLQQWTPMMTLQSSGNIQHSDSAAPYHPARRFYRAAQLSGTGHLTGDHLVTSAGEVVIHPVNHASFVMSWAGKMIYCDPVGGAALYAGFPKADLILVSHAHSDHYSSSTISGVLNSGGRIVVPKHIYDMTGFMSLRTSASYLRTGQTNPADNDPAFSVLGLTVEGVPAYNANHTKGQCNGYVLTIGDKRLFLTGDTGDTAEMRALANIDVAFLCMNVPFTMDVPTAASVVRAFRPKVVFPYHYRNQDNSLANLAQFKQLVGIDLGIEVRLRAWY